jgi:radical SAM superfamily enzyme YgiQ (UPF0313 family)
MKPVSPPAAGDEELHVVAPALTVRFTDSGPVASAITGRPGAATGTKPVGDGVFLAAGPDYPPHQMWVPLDLVRLEFLRRLVATAPRRLDQIVDEVARDSADEGAARQNLDRMLPELRAAGLIAPAAHNEWSDGKDPYRTDRIRWDHVPAATSSVVLDLADDRGLQRADRCALVVSSDGFERLHADGSRRDVLTSLDVMVLSAVTRGSDAQRVFETLLSAGMTMMRDEVDDRLRSLGDRGLVAHIDSDIAEKVVDALRMKERAYHDAEAEIRRLVVEERERAEGLGVKRPIVIAVDAETNPLLALGTVVAFAKAYDGGSLAASYRFAPILYTAPHRLPNLLPDLADWPTVFLFSDYTWTRDVNLAMCARVKEELPLALTIHGGPEMPKYAEDAEAFFRENPSVDCGVRGEGEATLAALLAALVPTLTEWSEGTRPPDLAALVDVEGLTFRTPNGLVMTNDRDRIMDVDTIPSPYLTGLFDDDGRRQADAVILESNRGCPYGCTFCDWGSATLSRIRKFSLDRVKAEMEWAAQRGIANIGLADANFGILERDVELAEWAVELKQKYGAPSEFQVTYAKSRVQNLTRIVRLLAEAEILTQAAISVQTMDEEVLQIVRRKNLDVEQHVPLVQEIEDLGLPIYSDIMLGLPGSTVDTVRADLQFCIDREIHYRPNPTQLLVNSPMNEEAYRLEHGIVAKPGEYLLESRTYSREDMRVMMDMAEFTIMADRRGTFRELATYVRREVGLPETRFYEQLIEAGTDSARWPYLGYVNTVVARAFIPPGSWTAVIEEIGEFMIQLGVADDDALATVLAVQRALIPMSGRSFPETLYLPHDYVAWHASVRSARYTVAEGRWVDEVLPLRSFGPGELVIHDDSESCQRVIGVKPRGMWQEIVWELETPIARAAQRVKDPV